jgi:FAD/FMN-containing dehydrogenase
MRTLIDIVGKQHVLTDNQDKRSYETPWRGEVGKAAFVIRPKNTEETSQVVSYLTRNNISFIPQSGNTGLVGASTPDQSGNQAVLSLNRLTDICEINTINKTARVGAGVKLSTLNQLAAEHDLFFPIDLASDPCVGGMVSTNTGGSRLLKYGDVRQNLLGLSVVLNDGTVLNMDNGLYKNNTGFDLKQIFIGTGGKNGVITECVVKLSSLPKQTTTALIVPASIQVVPNLLVELENRLGDELSAFEGMSKSAIEAAFTHNGSGIKNSFHEGIPDYVCLVELNRVWQRRYKEISLDEVLQTELEDIIQNTEGLIENAYFGNADEHWKLRHAISEGVQKSGKMVSFDISFERDKALEFLNFIKKTLPEYYPNIKICDFGHIGDGAMHLNLVISPDDTRLQKPDFVPNLRKWMFERVVKDFGGSYSAEHGIGPLNQTAYDLYTADKIKAVAKNLDLNCLIKSA